jgi:tetratricopeptide (TPR) repeat protein
MRRGLTALVLGVTVAGVAQAAAPPLAYRPLTAEERRQLAALEKRMGEQFLKEDFEEVERLARQILALRRRMQGERHWQSVDARFVVEQCQRLRRVPATHRAKVVRALRLVEKAGALRAQGRYRAAEQADRQALVLRQKALGEEHPDTARSYNSVAYNLQAQGKYADARPLLERALALNSKALGQEHPDTATSYNNLASCLGAQGKRAQAQPLHEKALAIRKKALGEEHPDTVASYDSVALNLNAQGKYAAAQPLLERALRIRQKTLGEDHADTAQSYNNLAGNLNDQGKYAQAQPLYERALAIRKRALGEEHPDTATSYNDLAANLAAQGKYAAAQPLLERALRIRQKTLGEEHADTAQSYNNLAATLNDQGKYAQAQPLSERALAICQKALGEGHPHTATCYGNLAYNLNAQGKHAQAQPLFERALAICQKALGEEHPDTASSYNNVAGNLDAQGKYTAAQPLYERALVIRRQALGKDHPDTASSYNGLAANLAAQGKHTAAQPLFERALAIRQKALGEGHPDTATSYNNLAVNLQAQGKYALAQPLLERALAIRQKVLGEDHPDTAQSYNSLAVVLWQQGKKERAVRHWQAACRGRGVARIDRAGTGFDRSFAEGGFPSPNVALAAALAGQGKAAEAFGHAEADLARGLLEGLGTGTPARDQQRGAREARLQKLDALLLPLLSRSDLAEAQQHRLDLLLKERAGLLGSLARQAAEDSARLLLPLGRIQKEVPADCAVVLWVHAFPIGEHWACILRSKGPPLWQRLPGSGPAKRWTEEDRDLPARLLALLNNPHSSAAQRQRLLRALRRQRLEPLRAHLKGVRRLLLVPTFPMEALPFEALSDDYQVSYIPSASLFARGRQGHRRLRGSSLLAVGDPVFTPPHQPVPPEQGVLLTEVLPKGEAERAGLRAGDVLLRLAGRKLSGVAELRQALADLPAPLVYWREGRERTTRLAGARLGVRVDTRPAPEAVKGWRALDDSLLLRGTGHRPLPGTRREVRALARLIPAATVLLGSAASEQSLAQLAGSGKLKSYRLLHFATHGEVNRSDPRLSALILSQDRLPPHPAEAVLRGQKPLDGRLTVETILEKWELDADLVVLSACQSGLGRNAGGEGLVGLAQAFLQKQARAVVVSRWRVDDTATTLLMVRFYENLLGRRKGTRALGRAAALDEARRWLRRLGRQQALALAGRLQGGGLRGTEEEVPLLAAKEAKVPGGQRPFAHPFYWAAFILIGDPD